MVMEDSSDLKCFHVTCFFRLRNMQDFFRWEMSHNFKIEFSWSKPRIGNHECPGTSHFSLVFLFVKKRIGAQKYGRYLWKISGN